MPSAPAERASLFVFKGTGHLANEKNRGPRMSFPGHSVLAAFMKRALKTTADPDAQPRQSLDIILSAGTLHHIRSRWSELDLIKPISPDTAVLFVLENRRADVMGAAAELGSAN